MSLCTASSVGRKRFWGDFGNSGFSLNLVLLPTA